jgi:hypothetical protein
MLMKKNLYYRDFYGRTNKIKELILNLILFIASGPKLLLEVFIRKNFGERYFSLFTAVVMIIVLALAPFMMFGAKAYFQSYGEGSNWVLFIWAYLTWYVFLAAFAFFTYQRWKEVKRNPSVFNFKCFSLYSGDIHSRFFTIKLFGKKTPSIRDIEIVYEPMFFFAVGFLLAMFGQAVGFLIIVCSMIYSLSYAGAYYKGDQFVMNKIDEMICSEEMLNTFVENKGPGKTRGVRFYGRKPVDPETRRRVVNSFFDGDDDEAFVAR